MNLVSYQSQHCDAGCYNEDIFDMLLKSRKAAEIRKGIMLEFIF